MSRRGVRSSDVSDCRSFPVRSDTGEPNANERNDHGRGDCGREIPSSDPIELAGDVGVGDTRLMVEASHVGVARCRHWLVRRTHGKRLVRHLLQLVVERRGSIQRVAERFGRGIDLGMGRVAQPPAFEFGALFAGAIGRRQARVPARSLQNDPVV